MTMTRTDLEARIRHAVIAHSGGAYGLLSDRQVSAVADLAEEYAASAQPDAPATERATAGERAPETAQARLEAAGAFCRKHDDWVSLHCPDLGRPSEALVHAGDILALLDGREPRERLRSVPPERHVLDRVRELAESWARRARAGRTVAEDFTISPHDAVPSDCGREILAVIGGKPDGTPP